jgi:hypothetical protein
LGALPRDLNLVRESLDKSTRLIRYKIGAELVYNELVQGVLMLYLGEEAPTELSKSRSANLETAHPSLFQSIRTIETQFQADSTFSFQITKLFEPILIDLVAEDGSGSAKL